MSSGVNCLALSFLSVASGVNFLEIGILSVGLSQALVNFLAICGLQVAPPGGRCTKETSVQYLDTCLMQNKIQSKTHKINDFTKTTV